MPENAAPTEAPTVPPGPADEISPVLPEPDGSPQQVVQEEPKLAQPFNLRKPTLITANELRRLRLRHDEFAHSLATQLSIHLRLEIAIQVLTLETCYYPEFLQRLLNPTQVVLFGVDSLEGVGLLEIPPKLGLALVDRLLGGSGKTEALSRDLTEIEAALLDQVVDLVLKQWCQDVSSLPNVKPAILGHEANPRFLQTVPNDSSVLMLILDVHIHDSVERVHLALPSSMFQAVLRRMNPPPDAKPQPAPQPLAPLKWNPELDSIKVPLSVQWNGLEIDARKLAHLRVGDVLPVDPDQINRTCVHLARVPKFSGRLGKCGQAWAIELLQRI